MLPSLKGSILTLGRVYCFDALKLFEYSCGLFTPVTLLPVELVRDTSLKVCHEDKSRRTAWVLANNCCAETALAKLRVNPEGDVRRTIVRLAGVSAINPAANLGVYLVPPVNPIKVDVACTQTPDTELSVFTLNTGTSILQPSIFLCLVLEKGAWNFTS